MQLSYKSTYNWEVHDCKMTGRVKTVWFEIESLIWNSANFLSADYDQVAQTQTWSGLEIWHSLQEYDLDGLVHI